LATSTSVLFLDHWLGDIYQPLHISFADDLGGNSLIFSHLATKCKNLHWYWDECILYKGNKSKMVSVINNEMGSTFPTKMANGAGLALGR
jgi:hypothetical protein